MIDVIAHVVAKYGFADGLEGVMESIRVLQSHAKSDESLVKQLIALRKVFTPTGDWVREDGEAEQEDQKRREAEIAAHRKQREEAERAEQLAIENARLAKIRAKKIALGLDPSVLRLPILVEQPPSVIALHEFSRDIRLQVNGDYIQSYQWFFNGQAIATEELVRGIRRSMLVIPLLTKRVAGEYYCICTNEDGRTSSRACQVMIARLGVSRGLSKKLRSYPSSPLVLCGSHAITYCVGHSVVVMDTNTLAYVKIIPPIPSAKQTIGYDARRKMLVTVSIPSKEQAVELSLYAIDTSSMDPLLPTTSSSSQKAIPPPPGRKGSSKRLFQAADTAPPGAIAVKAERLSSHTIKGSMTKAVHALQFFAHGQLIAISDLDRRLVVWSLSSSPSSGFSTREVFTHVQSDNHCLCNMASTPNHELLALSCRNHTSVQLFNFKTVDKPQSHQLQFNLPVHRTAFDHEGFFLAAAEAGTMKSWISIVNLNTMRVSRVRFEAHLGKVSSIQWTKTSSLLVTSGFDGYVKVWAVDAASTPPSCLLSVNVDLRGIHSATILHGTGLLLAVGYTDSRLQTRAIAHFNDFELSRRMQMDAHTTRIQKIWKGWQTRELIAKFIKQPK